MRELINMSVFLLVKSGHNSLWNTVAVIIYHWECAEIKLQLQQRQCDILGTCTV